VVIVYGVKYDAHHAVWMGKQDVISIIERPGVDGRTEIIAETLAEYNRAAQAPKTANPLQ
jgi:SRSO17 transposase